MKKHQFNAVKFTEWLLFIIIMIGPFIAILIESNYMIYNEQAPSNYTGVPQDVFYNAVNNVSTKTIFNWVTGTGMYATISSMLTGLDISVNIFPLLLTYWMMNTLIFAVFDIIIKAFSWIINIASSKK